MKKTFVQSVVLGIIAIGFIVKAISSGAGSLAWLPYFIMALFFLMKIADINKVGQNSNSR